jgi:hypothetical protein
MAIINKTGITNGGTIQAEHVTRAIDALSGGSTDTIVATGSFSGSLTGIATSASFATTASFALNAGGAGFPFTGSAQITGSLAVTGSFRQIAPGVGTVINSDSNGILTLQHNNINVSSSVVSFDPNASLNLSNIFKNGGLQIPVTSPGATARTGSMYFDIPTTTLYVYDGTQWTFIQLTT